VNVTAGVSSTYACVNCCDDSFHQGTIEGPDSAASGTADFSADQLDFTC
jgi:hypothetical protein